MSVICLLSIGELFQAVGELFQAFGAVTKNSHCDETTRLYLPAEGREA